MEYEEFKEKLTEKLRKIQIDISDIQIKQFYDYMNLLIEWNKKINLTAIIEPDEIILKHFIDSLTINNEIKRGDKIADIGTGAGFPGIPIKILNPENEVVLIDSLNKRLIFLDEVINKLGLKNISTVHARAEEIGHNKMYREQFDIVTSRAVAKLNVLLEYMKPLTKIGGKCICLKGPNIKQEISEAKNALEILGGEITKISEITLPGSDNKRTIINVLSVKHLPNRYPRKPGAPTDSPL
mgnify:CR=1 FL=1